MHVRHWHKSTGGFGAQKGHLLRKEETDDDMQYKLAYEILQEVTRTIIKYDNDKP